MPRQQIIITVIAILTVVGLYQLPKSVVDNDEQTLATEAASEVHTLEISGTDQQIINDLRTKLLGGDLTEKSITFADSLARTFLVYSELDSAFKYADLMLEIDQSTATSEKSANIYYQAFGFISDQEKLEKISDKIRQLYGRVLEVDASRDDLEARVAMTYVSGANPMEGIMKLRELVDQNESNIEAQFNLGLLSIQSGQFDRAVERFRKVQQLAPSNMEAIFYLGVSLFENGEQEKAKELLEQVINESNNAAMIEMAGNYLEDK
ncbi:MAG: tetratricopeptide repeat protein [Cyclobacteriaceae bacterium]